MEQQEEKNRRWLKWCGLGLMRDCGVETCILYPGYSVPMVSVLW